MTYVVSLEDFIPPARFDDPAVPWNRARIEESPLLAGTYTAIQTITLDPLDDDPSEPQPRDLTSALATLASGWYRVVFLDAANHESAPSEPVSTAPVEVAAYSPAIADVGALLRARTVDTDGEELGTFTTATRPTANQVSALISDAVRDVRRRAGPALDEEDADAALIDSARKLAAIRAAMYVELSYFPEQVADDQSPYGRFKEMWDEDIAALLAGLSTDPGDTQGWASVVVASPTAAAYQGAFAGVDPFTVE